MSTSPLDDRLNQILIRITSDEVLSARGVGATAMLVRDLFSKDIFRPINGVVKADQVAESTVWQELDEFVVTRELESMKKDQPLGIATATPFCPET